jgi:signal transduction histidine kinase
MSDPQPSSLTELHRRYIVEETASALRHDLRNKFASISNARFYLKRRFETGATTLWQEDARVPKLFDLISSELVAAEATLTSKLPTLSTEMVVGATCDATAVIRRRIAATSCPDGIALTSRTFPEAMVVAVDGLELELALWCLIENAIDAGSRTIAVGCAVDDAGRVAIEILDDGCGLVAESKQRALEPFFTTKSGRLGIGLNIAKRVAYRAKGELQLAARTDVEGVRAALLLPRVER